MAHLGVNIDHVATLRQCRGGTEPDPVAAAVLVERAGADGIVVHLREDRRHIQDRDLQSLKQTIRTRLNLEMAATDEMQKMALQIRPHQVTLVPENRMELTTEGGLNLEIRTREIGQLLHELCQAGIATSLFIDPDVEQIRKARKLNAQCIEIHTGRYANARSDQEVHTELDAIVKAAKEADALGLRVHAGHGLDCANIHPLTKIREIREFNIGHSIIARAVMIGLDQAVSEIKKLIPG